MRVKRSIVFVDIVESVRLYESDEEQAANRVVDMLRSLGNEPVTHWRGDLVRRTGDGLIATFVEAQDAIQYSLAAQQFAQTRESALPPDERIFLRIGVHAGPIIRSDGDIFGREVNRTARLAGLCAPGEILISDTVRDRVAIAAFEHEDLGEKYLKHINEPTRIFRVGQRRQNALPAAVAPLSHTTPTLAVAPFDVAELAQKSAAPVLMVELTRLLAASQMITVISAASAAAANCLGGEWESNVGADYVLGGQIKEMDETSVAFTVQLTDAEGHIVWEDHFSAGIEDLIGPAPRVSFDICQTVCGRITATELTRSSDASPDTLAAYTLFLSGLAHMHRLNRQEFEKAPSFLSELLERAPRQAAPNAWLAYWHVMSATQRWSRDPLMVASQALALAGRALEIDPDCALAHSVSGLTHMNLLRDPGSARAELEKAVSTGPNEAIAWAMRGTLRAFTDDGPGAVADASRALRLAPMDPHLYYFEGHAAGAYFTNADYAQAYELASRSYRGNRRHTSTLRIKAAALVQLDRMTDARAAMTELMRVDPHFRLSDYQRNAPNAGTKVGSIMADALRAAGAPQ